MQVKKQQLELDMEQQTGSKLGKVYIKAVYCHPAYLTSVKGKSCGIPGCMNHKLESRLLGEISTTSDKQKSYNKPRQCIKKQRHHFAGKGLYRESYGFSSSHIRM